MKLWVNLKVFILALFIKISYVFLTEISLCFIIYIIIEICI